MTDIINKDFSSAKLENLSLLISKNTKRIIEKRETEAFSFTAPPIIGTLWTTTAGAEYESKDVGVDRTLPMVILAETPDEDEQLVQCVPTSLWMEFASNKDLKLPENATHPDLIAEYWNIQPIMRSQLYKCVGILSEKELEYHLSMIYERYGMIEKANVPDCLRGELISDKKDIRILFQNFEMAFSIPIRAKAMEILEGKIVAVPEMIKFTPPPHWIDEIIGSQMQMAAAAMKKETRAVSLYSIPDKNLFIQLSPHKDRKNCDFHVLDIKKTISHVLDGCFLQTADGEKHLIEKGHVELPTSRLQRGFKVLDRKNSSMDIKPVRSI
jgi:hypothetical protein